MILAGVALFVVRRVKQIYPVSYQSIVEGVKE
jgi:hypothetical protein